MIDLYTGKPGSGKTYRAVYDAYKLRKKYYIIHNIEGLKNEKFHYINEDTKETLEHCVTLESVGGEELLQNYDGKFAPFCEKILKDTGKHCLFIIDECYQYMDKDYAGIKRVLAQHRHTGSDMWLIAQHIMMIATSYRRLIRFEIRCKSSGLFNFLGIFLYSHRQEGEGFKLDFRRKCQKVYDLYQSAMVHTNKSTMLVPLVALALIPLVWWFFQNPLELKANESEAASVVPVSAPVASSPASNSVSDPLVPSGREERPRTEYKGPKVINHMGESVAIEHDDGKKEVILLKEFVYRYPPDLYGYSYLSAPSHNRFILMDRSTAAVIYPVDNVFLRSQNFIASSKVLPQNNFRQTDPVQVDVSDSPDSSGYSEKDKAYLRRLQDVLNPFKPIRRE